MKFKHSYISNENFCFVRVNKGVVFFSPLLLRVEPTGTVNSGPCPAGLIMAELWL